jgi:RNA recognition motif-containing protein
MLVVFFQHMEREEEAKIAIAGLNGHEFQGSQLNVEVKILMLWIKIIKI